ncbi:hypothetical protein ACPV5U_19325 [Vibrio mediterranei]
MTGTRISAGQKEVLLQLHFNELKVEDGSTLATSTLRQVVEDVLGRMQYPNHFSASLHRLVRHGYLTVEYNVERRLKPLLRENEAVWALTSKGRQYAETLHSARLRPIRSYTKSCN